MEPMTEQEYAEQGGNVCPYCRSKDVESQERVQVDSYGGTQRVGCEDCGRRWYDTYTLTGFMPEEG